MAIGGAPKAEQHVAGVNVLVAGSPLDQALKDLLAEVRVRDTLVLPDAASVRLTDPDGSKIDSLLGKFAIGAALEIKTAPPSGTQSETIFKGEVVAQEPEFGKEGASLVVRALDKGHKLQRVRKVRTFQQMSASDMVSKIAGEAGLSAQVTSTSVIFEFFQQSAETDWDFIARLARMHDYRFGVDASKLVFEPAGNAEGAAVTLKWQEELLSFRPRVSGVQQVQTLNIRSWDPKNKQAVTASASSPPTSSTPGVQRSSVSNGAGGGTQIVGSRVAATSGEANAIVKSALQARADAFMEAEGVAKGNPKVKAGTKVNIQGVGSKMSGAYLCSSTTHLYRGGKGYTTSFTISGRSERGMLDLFHPPEKDDWSKNLVVGIVTNNNDPEQAGRVRVKYPSLSDSEESAWARVASFSAGNARGGLMLPQPDEEVIVGFEHGDARRPVVLGSLFNGKDKPGADLMQNRDGSFAVLSNEKVHMHAKKDIEIKSDQALMIEITKDATTKAQGKIQQEASQGTKLKAGTTYEIEAGSSMTLKGVSVTVEASAQLKLKGSMVDVESSGPLNLKGAIINIG